MPGAHGGITQNACPFGAHIRLGNGSSPHTSPARFGLRLAILIHDPQGHGILGTPQCKSFPSTSLASIPSFQIFCSSSCPFRCSISGLATSPTGPPSRGALTGPKPRRSARGDSSGRGPPCGSTPALHAYVADTLCGRSW